MNKSIFTALWFYACCMMSLTASAQTDYIRFVDPFIGSGGAAGTDEYLQRMGLVLRVSLLRQHRYRL